MKNLQDLLREIRTFVLNNGYCEKIYNGEHLSSFVLREYFVKRNEKYKIGLVPSSSPKLSYFICRVIYDGMAWAYYLDWPTRHFKEYYYFRKGYSSCLDIGLIALETPGELSEPDEWVISKLFSSIEKIANQYIEDEEYLDQIDDSTLDVLLPSLHITGMSIYYSWKNKTSLRFQFVDNLFIPSSTAGFNPFDI